MFYYLGIIFLFYSVIIASPLLVALLFTESIPMTWAGCVVVYGLFSFILIFNNKKSLHFRSSISLVLVAWFSLSLAAAVPLWLDPYTNMSFVQAWFESTSGLTTTGSSIVASLAGWPHYLVFYHQLLQYIGGLGILVLVMTVLPMAGSGALAFFRSQVQGSVIDDKFMPRFRDVANWLLGLYLIITVCACGAYMAVGMPVFDALCFTFSTISTGGFVFESDWLYHPGCQWVSTVVMLISATGFKLHFLALKQKSLKYYFENDEFKQWWWAIAVVCLIVWLDYELHHSGKSFLPLIFQVVSLMSSTGYMLKSGWTLDKLMLVCLIILGYVGGCSGSTSSGIKWERIAVVRKVMVDALHRILHPHQVIGDHPRTRIIPQVLAYFILLFCTVCVVSLLFYSSGLSMAQSVSVAWATTTNLGATIDVHFHLFNALQAQIATWAMLIGRVECITFYIVFMRQFWWR